MSFLQLLLNLLTNVSFIIKSFLLAVLVNIFFPQRTFSNEQQNVLRFLSKISVVQEGANSFFFIYSCDLKGERYSNEADAVLKVTVACPSWNSRNVLPKTRDKRFGLTLVRLFCL